ncbi:MAG: OsmC family protein [Saprospiraceae bacterium]|nr:OsmC family protein [Saprospiraceae bacterium]MBK9720839.1 OsmC family protein [Saprospiraceae bacterium]
METAHYYDVTAKWENARKGSLTSNVLSQTIEVATPPQFPGGIDNIWSPEHLFVAAVNSCLMTTFLAIAENSMLKFGSFESKAVGKLEKVEGKYCISEIELTPIIQIQNEAEREKAERILIKSEAACLISNSIKSKIIFNPIVILN